MLLDQIGDRRARVCTADGPDGWRGKNYVADQAEADQKDLGWQA
jgi:hypothetical protein